MDGGAWWATVHGVAESRTGLSNWHFHFSFSSILSKVKGAVCCSLQNQNVSSTGRHFPGWCSSNVTVPPNHLAVLFKLQILGYSVTGCVSSFPFRSSGWTSHSSCTGSVLRYPDVTDRNPFRGSLLPLQRGKKKSYNTIYFSKNVIVWSFSLIVNAGRLLSKAAIELSRSNYKDDTKHRFVLWDDTNTDSV